MTTMTSERANSTSGTGQVHDERLDDRVLQAEDRPAAHGAGGARQRAGGGDRAADMEA